MTFGQNQSGIADTRRRGLSRFAALATATALAVGAFTATAHADAPSVPALNGAHAAKARPTSSPRTLNRSKIATNRTHRAAAPGGWVVPTELASQGLDGTVDETQGTSHRTILPSQTQLFRSLLNLGDLNGDGLDDLLTITGSGQLQFRSSTGATTVLGGGWQTYNQVTVIGDLNGDSRADLIARDTAGKLWLFQSTTTGGTVPSFSARKSIGSGWNMYDQLVGVPNFDASPGSLVARDFAGNLYRYDLNSTGGYGARKLIGSGWGMFNQLISADVNSDGRADLLGRTIPGLLSGYFANGAGGTGTSVYLSKNWYGTSVLANQGGAATWGKTSLLGRMSNGDLYFYYGFANDKTTGASIDHAAYTPSLMPAIGYTVSMDDSGDAGLYGRVGSTLYNLYTGNSVASGIDYNAIIGSGDLNGDGRGDLLARAASGHLYFLRGNGAGGVAGRVDWGSGWNMYNRLFGAGDLTGDGIPDLLATTPGGALYLYPGKAGGGFGGRTLLGNGWQTMRQVAAPGDLNGDGKGDLMAVDAAGKLWEYPAIGNGKFKPRVLFGTGWGMFRNLY